MIKLALDTFVKLFKDKHPFKTLEFLIEQFEYFSEFDSSISESDVKLLIIVLKFVYFFFVKY